MMSTKTAVFPIFTILAFIQLNQYRIDRTAASNRHGVPYMKNSPGPMPRRGGATV
jgi:hypothetical protein